MQFVRLPSHPLPIDVSHQLSRNSCFVVLPFSDTIFWTFKKYLTSVFWLYPIEFFVLLPLHFVNQLKKLFVRTLFDMIQIKIFVRTDSSNYLSKAVIYFELISSNYTEKLVLKLLFCLIPSMLRTEILTFSVIPFYGCDFWLKNFESHGSSNQ